MEAYDAARVTEGVVRMSPYGGGLDEVLPGQAVLAEMAERYRLLVEFTPDLVCVHVDRSIVYVNPATVRFFGFADAGALVGRSVDDLIIPSERSAVADRLAAAAVHGGSSGPAEVTLLRDGKPVPAEATTVATVWSGRPAYQVILRDLTHRRAAEEALRFGSAVLDHVSDAVIAIDDRHIIESWNPAARRLYGHSDEVIGSPVADVLGADIDAAAVVALGGRVGVHCRHSDGRGINVRLSVAPMGSGWVLLCTDDVDRGALQRFAEMVSILEEATIVVGADGMVQTANSAATELLGLPRSGAGDVSVNDLDLRLIDEWNSLTGDEPRQHAGTVNPLWAAVRLSTGFTGKVVRARSVGRDPRWLVCSCHSIDLDDEHILVATFTDITRQRADAERHDYDTTHDALTGLPNRAGIHRHLDSLLSRSGVDRQHIALYFVDLDFFKLVNDSLGHSVGDEVLRVISRRLVTILHDGELVGRHGSDEFVIISTTANPDQDEAVERAGKIFDLVAEVIYVGYRELRVDSSIGIVTAPDYDTRTSADLLRDADVALNQAKTERGTKSVVFTVQLREELQRRQLLQQDLRAAASLLKHRSDAPTEELFPEYQPIIDLATGRMRGIEALMRWQHPELGRVGPGEFIPLAEQSDLIEVLTEHIFVVSGREVGDLCDDHGLVLNINLSARQLNDPSIVDRLCRAADSVGFPPASLCVELTESALVGAPETAAQILERLRAVGVGLAIDDFGTGYSSLEQLHRLPVDVLKIAQPFVADLGRAPHSEDIVAAVVAMAHATGVSVIAEGVETADQRTTVTALGCDMAQGYLFMRPGSRGAIEDYIRRDDVPTRKTR